MHDLGTIVGVWAHPDDEAYLSAGLMALAADEGRRVVCVTATKGELGFPDDDPRPPAARMALREQELRDCLAVLGVREHRWLGYPDAGCKAVDVSGPVATLVAILEEVQPDTVLTFGPDGGTYHDDHIAVSRWTTLACRAIDRPDMQLMYATKSHAWIESFASGMLAEGVMMIEDARPVSVPLEEMSVVFELDDHLLDRKVRALRAQASQIEGLMAATGVELFTAFNREEFFRLAGPDDWP